MKLNHNYGSRVRISIVLVLCLISNSNSFSAVFRAVSSGDWSNSAIWDVLPFDGVGGDGVPGDGDIAITNGFNIGIDTDITVDRITVEGNTANSLFYTDPFFTFSPRTITINLSLSSTVAPTTTVIENTSLLNFVVLGTGTNVINNWSTNAPINSVTFNSGGTTTLGTDLPVGGGALTVNSGSTLIVSTGSSITDFSGSSTINVSSGGFLTVNGAVNGNGTSSSRFSTININGDVITGTAGYINVSNFNLNAGATLDVQFIGTGQDEGWWSGSIRPTTFSVDATSTITYSANTNVPDDTQNIYPTSEPVGNLTLSGTATKALSNNIISLDIDGDLIIASGTTFNTSANTEEIFVAGNVTDNGGWAPTQQVIFDGSTQSISGISVVSFEGGLRVNGVTNTNLTLSNTGIDVNGVLDIDAAATFSPDDQDVNLSGNLINDGTLNAGTVNSTFTFDGTTAINGTGSTSFNDLVVSNSNTLTSSSGTINVSGNFTNNGTFNRNAGTVNFNGSGSIAGTVGFENMNIDGTVTNTGTVQLYGTFTPVTGSFNTGNDFTVMSTSLSGDGRIAAVPLPGFTFTGNLTAQRFVDGVFDGDWRYISSPVVGATLNNWQNSGMPITGDFSDASPTGVNNVVSSAVPSVYARNSVAGTWDAVTAAGGATSTVTLVNGTGYSAYTYVNGNLTLEVTGTLRSGNVSIPLTGATTAVDPFYLIGNPYPSPIDWDLVRDAANTDLGVTMYLRTSLDNYASYNAELNLSGGVNPPPSWGGEILMGQSFWVNSNNTATSVSITEGMKSAVGNGQFLREAEGSNEVISIKLSNETQNDKTVVFLKAGATDAFDYEYDGKKQLNGNFSGATGRRSWMNLSSYNALDSGQLFVFNGVDNDFCNKEVGLVVNDLAEGSYVLEFDKYTLAGYSVKLVDAYADSEITISEGATYAFDVSPDTTSYGNRRFKLVMEATAIERDLDFNTSVNNDCDVDYVEVVLDDVQEGVEYVLKGPDGNNLSNPAVAPGSQVVLFINKLNLEDAVNSISVLASTPSSCIGDVIYTNSITYDYNPKPGISVVSAGAKCKGDEQPLTLSVSGAPANGYYRWYDSPESLEPIASEDQDELVLNNVKSTRSYYASAVNSEGCESERVKVMAEVLEIETPALVVEGQVLIAPAAESYQWYLDDEPIAGADEQELTVSSTGEYKVEVFNAGCSSFSEAMAFSITSIDDELYDLGLSVYPNPTVNRLNFNFFKEGGQADQLQLVLYDIEGKIVKTEEDVIHSNSKGDSYMSVGDLEKGLFILNIKLNNKIISLQIIKME